MEYNPSENLPSNNERLYRLMDAWTTAGCAVGLGLLGLVVGEAVSPELSGTIGDTVENSIEVAVGTAGLIGGALLGRAANRH